MADKAPTLTENEMKVLVAGWKCIKGGPPEIDKDELAKELGHTNPQSARNAWSSVHKKLAAIRDFKAKANGNDTTGTDGSIAANGSKSTTPKTPKTPKKRNLEASDEDGAVEESPTKKTKGKAKTALSSATVKEEDDLDIDMPDAAPVEAAKSPKTSKKAKAKAKSPNYKMNEAAVVDEAKSPKSPKKQGKGKASTTKEDAAESGEEGELDDDEDDV